MIRYNSGKFSRFFVRYDWNRLFQEISTILISVGLGLYFYENKSFSGLFSGLEGGNIPGSDALAETSRPYVTAGIIVIIICSLIKIAIYSSMFDANSLKSGRSPVKSKKPRGLDYNSIAQEILTVLLGITVGMFSTPVVKNAFIFEKAEYPDPTVGILLSVCCFGCKILLYSKSLNFNSRSSMWNPQRLRPFLGKSDWNEFFQEFSTTFIGVGLGFYMYESRIVFLPEKWFPGVFGNVAQETTNIFERITEGTPFEKSLKFVPDLFNNEAARPYIIAGGIIIGICAIMKIAIYTSLWNANQLRDYVVGKRKSRYPRNRVDYNGIAEEIVTLVLTTLFGIVVTPLLSGAMSGEQQGDSHFQVIVLCLVLVLAWMKLAFITGSLEFTLSSRRMKTSSIKRQKRR